MRYRLLIQPPLLPSLALATDEAIARCCRRGGGRITLRFYQWDRPAISLGRFQQLDTAVRVDAVRKAAIPILRRITGGRAVYHHHELTYSIVSPLPSAHFGVTLRDTVTNIGHALAGGLTEAGIPARLSDPDDAPHSLSWRQPRHPSPDCFATSAWYEITCGGKKLIGSAQRRWHDRFLQQGSLLIRHEPELIRQWLRVDGPAADHTTSLSSLDGPWNQHADWAGFARGLAQSMAADWGIALDETGLTMEEQELARKLAATAYTPLDYSGDRLCWPGDRLAGVGPAQQMV